MNTRLDPFYGILPQGNMAICCIYARRVKSKDNVAYHQFIFPVSLTIAWTLR